jgi:hypothetical protein
MTTYRTSAALVAAAIAGLLAVAPVAEAQRATVRLGPTTLRDCEGKDPADPINVGFVGSHASWQNSQRLVGKDGEGPELMWRTTRAIAGGAQSIQNGTVCTRMDAQSARGTGVRRSEANAKRHTRFFEQLLAYTLNDDDSFRSLLTGQDAHRDIKRGHCRGPGSVGRLNDAVPRDIDGFEGGGYDSAQRLFLRAFDHRRSRVRRGPAQMRFVQCGHEAPPLRYSVGWNGILQTFRVDGFEECQGDWHRRFAPDLGDCPTERGREGEIK